MLDDNVFSENSLLKTLLENAPKWAVSRCRSEDLFGSDPRWARRPGNNQTPACSICCRDQAKAAQAANSMLASPKAEDKPKPINMKEVTREKGTYSRKAAQQ